MLGIFSGKKPIKLYQAKLALYFLPRREMMKKSSVIFGLIEAIPLPIFLIYAELIDQSISQNWQCRLTLLFLSQKLEIKHYPHRVLCKTWTWYQCLVSYSPQCGEIRVICSSLIFLGFAATLEQHSIR